MASGGGVGMSAASGTREGEGVRGNSGVCCDLPSLPQLREEGKEGDAGMGVKDAMVEGWMVRVT